MFIHNSTFITIQQSVYYAFQNGISSFPQLYKCLWQFIACNQPFEAGKLVTSHVKANTFLSLYDVLGNPDF